MKKYVIQLVWAVAVVGLAILGYRHFFLKPPVATSAPDGDIPVVFRTNGGLLEVGTVVYKQRFSLKQYYYFLGSRIDLCPTTASVAVKAYFTYRVRLTQQWPAKITADKRVVLVVPALEPALPVAIDTATLDESLSGCPFIKDRELLNELRKRLSANLAAKANRSDYKQLVRDRATRTVSEFIRTWYLSQDDYAYAKDYKIEVHFKGDPIEKLM